jgi:prolyl-tRNA editing enzyme YbaK/EbsC (Cys-tRNA(Pro) deacylase)
MPFKINFSHFLGSLKNKMSVMTLVSKSEVSEFTPSLLPETKRTITTFDTSRMQSRLASPHVKRKNNTGFRKSVAPRKTSVYVEGKHREKTRELVYEGKKIDVFTLREKVVSCEQAAHAKGIPLKNELKTLVIETDDDIYLLHLLGDEKADFKQIRKLLNTKKAQLLCKEKLLTLFAVTPGTVNPFSSKLKNQPQLVSEEVLRSEFLSTNAGTLYEYVIFEPSLLFSTNKSIEQQK